MTRSYMVVDTEGRGRMHWNTDIADDWAEFLMDCRDKLKSGVYEEDFKILIDEQEYCAVGELL